MNSFVHTNRSSFIKGLATFVMVNLFKFTQNSLWKKCVLQLTLQLNFWIAMTTCNAPYFYVVDAMKQIAWVAKVVIHYIYNATHYNSITILLKQFIFNYYVSPLQLQP
jgi:hypothetical protein